MVVKYLVSGGAWMASKIDVAKLKVHGDRGILDDLAFYFAPTTSDDVKFWAPLCVKASGYELLPPRGPPTKEQRAVLCEHQDKHCEFAFKYMRMSGIPDCSITMPGGSTTTMRRVIKNAFSECKWYNNGVDNWVN